MTRDASSDSGFGLVEAIVALAIIAGGLAAFCQATGNAYRTAARLKINAAALAIARSHLDLLGQDGALEAGVTTGRYGNDLPWRLTVSALLPGNSDTASASRPYWLMLETFDRRGAPLVKLETAKLMRETP